MQIFVSYASEHHSLAKEVALAIRELGHTVFFDKADLPPAQSFHSRVRKAVSQCDGFIFLISPESIAEGRYTLTELGYAEERWPHPGNRVLPVVIQTVEIAEIPEYLRAVSLQEPTGNIPAEIQAVVARWNGGRSWQRPLFIGASVALVIFAGLAGPKLIDRWTGSANGNPAPIESVGAATRGGPQMPEVDSSEARIDVSNEQNVPATLDTVRSEELRMPLFGRVILISYANDESLAEALKDRLDRLGAQAQIRQATSPHARYSGGIVYQLDQERLAVAVREALVNYVALQLYLTEIVQVNSPLVIYLQ